MINSNSKFSYLRQQANKSSVKYRSLWCLCLVAFCSISYAQDGQGLIDNKPAVNVMHENGESWLVGPNGMTLYSMVKEKARVAACQGGCAINWPPLVVEENRPVAAPELRTRGDKARRLQSDNQPEREDKFSKVKRLQPDNRVQVTYKGRQLHYWSRDKMPGDMTGNGIGGIWFVARP